MGQDASIVLRIRRPGGMDLMEDLVRKIVRVIVDVADPDRIILFGSRGDGCARAESDFGVISPTGSTALW